ncbi:MAG: N-acyl homoserine lactonase family protein [Candidatus Lambdaproteobacteria bacterium]|nr:N-acyl homoserine lactonase family protein [Candidatus Lambdaproteobacteria bacterium]
MNPYKIYVLYYSKRASDLSQYMEGDTTKAPMEAAYYMWVVTNGEHTVAVDLGFKEDVGHRRDRPWIAPPGALYDAIKIDPKSVLHVVVTHMHWDHCGNYDMFPNARIYVQERELAFWTGANLQQWKASVEEADLVALLRLHFKGRLGLTTGIQEIVPGVKVHHVGGHTRGIQVVQAETAHGAAVVASDAVKLYRNLKENVPSPKGHDVPEMLQGYKLIRGMLAKEELLLPGHDATVMKRLPLVDDHVALAQ